MTRLLAAVYVAVLFVTQAVAQQRPCGPRANVIASAKKYGEGPVSFGGLDAEHVIELLLSVDGSFTIIQTDISGQSCVMVSGTGWDQYAYPRPSGRPM